MKTISTIIIMYLCLCIEHIVMGQNNIVLNQSAYNLFLLNPAAAGNSNEALANCHYKKNWFGMSDSPEMVQLTLDGPAMRNKFGVGLNISNNKTGIFSRTDLKAALKYKLKIKDNQFVSFGISAGFQRQFSDFSKIKAQAPEEFAQWPQQQASTIPDASAGLLYSYNSLVLSFSANQILGQKFTYKEPVYNSSLYSKPLPNFIVAVQNRFVLQKDLWTVTPSLILRSFQGLPVQMDLISSFSYRNKFIVGVGYRSFYALFVTLGYEISDRLRLLYSYEYSQKIQKTVAGGHEVGITFRMPARNKQAMASERPNNRKVDELLERIDQQEQMVEILNNKIDSLNKNNKLLVKEINDLKSNQVSEEEILKEIDAPENEKIKNKYKVITNTSGANLNDTLLSNYKIVYGVYRSPAHAKEYQKFLKRQLSADTKLVQLSDQARKFIYVCAAEEFTTLKVALHKLFKVREQVKNNGVEITRGEAWILQTSNN